MDFESVKSWLTRWTERQASHCQWKGIFGLVLTPIALAIALTGIYWLLRLFTHDRLYNPGNAKTCFWITAAIFPCLFILNRVMPRRNLMQEHLDEGPADSIFERSIERREVIILCCLWIVFTGPRLLDWSLASFRRVRRLRKMDVHSCAAVLWLALVRGKKVPYDNLAREFDWLDVDAILPELSQIPGIVFLKNPPPGLSLTQDLRDEIQNKPAQMATAGSLL